MGYDEYTREFNEKLARYKNKSEERKKLTETVQAQIDTREGRKLVAEIRRNSNNLNGISEAAMELRQKVSDLHHKEADLLAFGIDVNAAMEEQTAYARNIEQCRNIVSQFPRVFDPDLAAKNKAAADAYVAEVRRRLNEADDGMAAIANSLSEMMSLGSHPLFQRRTTEALNMVAELQMRKIRAKEDELEAVREERRAKEDAAVIKQIEAKIEAEIKKIEEIEERERILAEERAKNEAREKEEKEEKNEEEEQNEEKVFEEDDEMYCEDAE